MKDNAELKGLTTLRGAGAIMVVCFHMPKLFGLNIAGAHAYIAVDMFFILSGFVMEHVYTPRIRKGLGLGGFMMSRMARLYPIYALVTLAGFAYVALRIATHALPSDPRVLSDLAANLVFAPSSQSPSNPWNVAYPFALQAWSVAWEVVVGVAFFAWVRGGERFPWLVLVAALAILCWAVYGRADIDGGWQRTNFGIGAARALFGFALGVMTRRLMPLLGQVSQGVRRGFGWLSLAIGVGATAYAVSSIPSSAVVDVVLLTLASPFMAAGGALSQSRFMESRLGVMLGNISYSIYMWHVVLGALTGAVLARLPTLSMGEQHLFGPVWLAGLVGLSWLSWRFVEVPARRWIQAVGRRSVHRPVAGGAFA